MIYHDLLAREEPHPIKIAEQAADMQLRIDAMVARGNLSAAEQEYLALLGTLMMGWEEGQYGIPELTVSAPSSSSISWFWDQ